ncbi:hypothetical protein D9Q98_009138 [Chlorella vulgaris]|uniref:Uncharacterized protein n=1 Tax=Chlorella vulgaris TaxID=3077 RepID=A0A9D4TH88_CHLVU|nr:hypothetical protein D9Q98_009138 [Chlorella vulgaris]
MVNFKELSDDSTIDLGKQVERLRLEVQLAQQGYGPPPDAQTAGELELNPAFLESFKTPDDFTIREQTLNYSNGDSYTGETLGTLRHGRGKHTCSNSDIYDGQWRYDKRDGTGKMTFQRGVKYEGHWRDDKAHGSGAAQYENGGIYVGEFQNDHRWGWGTHYFPQGDKYEGEWVDDQITGKGRMTYADTSYYEGEWLGGKRVTGKLVAGDGSFEYSGGWKDDLRHGYGVMFQRGVFKFTGQWEGDAQQGEGKCIYADGSQYDGQWKAGLRHGRGRFNAGNARYDGEWAEDLKHGVGASLTECGDKYKGQFEAGKRHGKGLCVYVDGSKYEGDWHSDMRQGKGTCLFASGDKYQGEWQADKRHGYGVCRFADGRKFRGDWDEDGWVQSAADPQHCRVAGPGVTKAVAGKLAELAIEARDDNGCLRLSGGDEFQAALTGPAAVTIDVKDNDDGTYSLSYTATVAGVYELSITIGAEEHVAHSPYPLRVLPAAPCPKRCQVAGPGRSTAVAGQEARFCVEVQDGFGNRWSGDPAQLAAQLPLQASLCGGPNACELQLELKPTRDGVLECSYTAPTPGYWRLHISCRGQPLPRTPFSVQVADPAAAAAAACQAPAVDEGAAGDGTCLVPENGSEPSSDATAAADQLDKIAAAPSAVPLPGPPAVQDRMRAWEVIAAEAFAADGSMDGWDSDTERRKRRARPEDNLAKTHPGVPVVENLEDLWLVSRLQNERKAKEEKAKTKKLQGMRSQLEKAFGAPQMPTHEEVTTAVKEIVVADIQQQQQHLEKSSAGAKAAKAAAAEAAARGGRVSLARRGGRAALAATAASLSQLD